LRVNNPAASSRYTGEKVELKRTVVGLLDRWM